MRANLTPSAPMKVDLEPPSRGSLRPLRVLLLCAWMVPFLFLAAVAYRLWDIELQKASENVDKQLLVLREHGLKAFRTLDLLLSYVDDRIAGMSWDAIAVSGEVHRVLLHGGEKLDQLAAVSLADAAGTVRATSQAFPAPAVSVADRDYFGVLRARDVGAYVSLPAEGGTSDKAGFRLVRRRTSAEGDFEGLLIASVDPGYFANSYRAMAADSGDLIGLLRDDGTVLAGSALEDVGGTSRFRIPAARALMTSESERGETYLVGDEDGGTTWIAGMRRLTGYPAFVAYGIDHRRVVRAWLANLEVYGLVALASAAILSWTSWVAYDRARRETAVLAKWADEIEHRQVAEWHSKQSSKLEALGTLAGGIAHSFNNLFPAMSGLLEKTIGELAPGSNAVKRLTSLLIEVDQARRLLRQLLTFSRRDIVKFEPVDVGELVEAAAALLRAALPAHIRVSVSLSFTGEIVGDFVQLQHVILNLGTNAIHAIGDQPGAIELVSERVALDTEASKRLGLAEDAYARLSCIDNGSGIAPEIVEHIFDPFFTTKPPGEGSGMGLAIARGVALSHGGNIYAASILGKGTVMSLYLPISRSAAGGDRETSSPHPSESPSDALAAG